MVKKGIILSSVCISMLYAAEVQMDTITVEEKINNVIVKDVSGEEVKSADLAEALSRNVPSITLIRRSGIANDIILRGQKRDNINVIVDGTKTYGACVNRMDPPTSHVATQVIDNVVIKEGPFDVEEFGTLSGMVNITTKQPVEDFSGDVGVNVGSYGYKKASTTLSGGNDKVKVLVSVSKEEGDQYEDGDGNDFAQQVANYTASTVATTDDPSNYSAANKDMKAFEKTVFMGKVFVNVAEDQELKFSYTGNRSDDVLYPTSKMDAIWDDSDIFNIEYGIENLSQYSKKLDFQLYYSQVDHPMSTEYRNSGSTAFMTNHLTTSMTGVKIKNNFDYTTHNITYGIDMSRRNWDGKYTSTNVATRVVTQKGLSLDNVDTDNIGFFAKLEKTMGKLDIEAGARYDHTNINTDSVTFNDNQYNALNANIFLTYNADNSIKYFGGIGKSSRVPDARELYNTMAGGIMVNGTPNLDQTTNYEIDFGVEQSYENGKVKIKTFYSKLKDYIYYNSSAPATNNFENIDATIYGLELSGLYMATDELYFDFGLSYKQGKKDTLPTGQFDKDLAEISPLKLNAAATYEYDSQGSVQLSVVASDDWSNIDSDNGEQKLSGYTVLNFKTTREFKGGFEITAGVDNIFDKTYAITNTYKDLTLLTDGSDTMLINEPGRYFYINAKYKF